MNKNDFYFDLPEQLIAQYPLANRSDSRLLTYCRKKQQHAHHTFKNLPELLQEGDLLVMNDSKVIPARFYGTKATGGRVEFLLERLVSPQRFIAHIKASKTPKANSVIVLDKGWEVTVIEKQDDLYFCQSSGDLQTMLQEIGHIPLPPYITRTDEQLDNDRYQTIYARHHGSVAAPTAGLHFDETTFTVLKQKGIQIAYSTLHIGAGTFRPVRSESIYDHKMHHEQYEVSESLADAVNKTKADGGRVIAVGTTALRTLESAAANGPHLTACAGDTDIFIYPGYQFKVCDGLLTNFHLPESTLLMLVSAFIGHPEAMAMYQEAIANQYRFFSYGDANLLI